MDARLIVVGGKANKSEVKLKLPATIGRSRSADLTVAHPKVSRQHCQIFERDGLLVVRDTGSLNGTYVDDSRITEAILKPGDKLTVGPLTFVAAYETGSGDGTSTDDRTPAFEPSPIAGSEQPVDEAPLDFPGVGQREPMAAANLDFGGAMSDRAPDADAESDAAPEDDEGNWPRGLEPGKGSPESAWGPGIEDSNPPVEQPDEPEPSELLFGADPPDLPRVEAPQESDFRWLENPDIAETMPGEVEPEAPLAHPTADLPRVDVTDDMDSPETDVPAAQAEHEAGREDTSWLRELESSAEAESPSQSAQDDEAEASPPLVDPLEDSAEPVEAEINETPIAPLATSRLAHDKKPAKKGWWPFGGKPTSRRKEASAPAADESASQSRQNPSPSSVKERMPGEASYEAAESTPDPSAGFPVDEHGDNQAEAAAEDPDAGGDEELNRFLKSLGN